MRNQTGLGFQMSNWEISVEYGLFNHRCSSLSTVEYLFSPPQFFFYGQNAYRHRGAGWKLTAQRPRFLAMYCHSYRAPWLASKAELAEHFPPEPLGCSHDQVCGEPLRYQETKLGKGRNSFPRSLKRWHLNAELHEASEGFTPVAARENWGWHLEFLYLLQK